LNTNAPSFADIPQIGNYPLARPAFALPLKLVQGMDLDEVAAEKVRAILTREKARDIYDLAFLIENRKVKFQAQIVKQKLEWYGMKFDAAGVQKRLAAREKSFEKEMEPLMLGEKISFGHCRSVILGWMKE